MFFYHRTYLRGGNNEGEYCSSKKCQQKRAPYFTSLGRKSCIFWEDRKVFVGEAIAGICGGKIECFNFLIYLNPLGRLYGRRSHTEYGCFNPTVQGYRRREGPLLTFGYCYSGNENISLGSSECSAQLSTPPAFQMV